MPPLQPIIYQSTGVGNLIVEANISEISEYCNRLISEFNDWSKFFKNTIVPLVRQSIQLNMSKHESPEGEEWAPLSREYRKRVNRDYMEVNISPYTFNAKITITPHEMIYEPGPFHYWHEYLRFGWLAPSGGFAPKTYGKEWAGKRFMATAVPGREWFGIRKEFIPTIEKAADRHILSIIRKAKEGHLYGGTL